VKSGLPSRPAIAPQWLALYECRNSLCWPLGFFSPLRSAPSDAFPSEAGSQVSPADLKLSIKEPKLLYTIA
jgi:hypothetical protein